MILLLKLYHIILQCVINTVIFLIIMIIFYYYFLSNLQFYHPETPEEIERAVFKINIVSLSIRKSDGCFFIHSSKPKQLSSTLFWLINITEK